MYPRPSIQRRGLAHDSHPLLVRLGIGPASICSVHVSSMANDSRNSFFLLDPRCCSCTQRRSIFDCTCFRLLRASLRAAARARLPPPSLPACLVWKPHGASLHVRESSTSILDTERARARAGEAVHSRSVTFLLSVVTVISTSTSPCLSCAPTCAGILSTLGSRWRNPDIGLKNGLAFRQDLEKVGVTPVDWERGIVHCVLIQHLYNLSNHSYN